MKTSVKAAARAVIAEERRALTARTKDQQSLLQGTEGRTVDSFVNFAQKMGIGADNALSTSRYGFNPITRNRIQLEWMHRGAWVAGVAVDVVADDMTRAGADFACEMDPQDSQKIERAATTLGVWDTLGDAVRWGRLYGGGVAVMLVDGQDMRQPLRPETVGPQQFKGLMALDRWMLEADLTDLVSELGPDLGKPKYYRVQENAPALRHQVIHHSRLAIRHCGIELPYQQALTEQLWGLSILERLYDRLSMFDSASTGAGQLVYKAWLRTLKVKDLRAVISAGNKALEGLTKYAETMRRYQNLEGLSLIDAEDELEVQEHGAFSGLAEVVMMFAQQISGALQIPMVRLFGMSPGGMNATGESDVRTYYDGINQRQNRDMHRGVNMIYSLISRSEGIKPPEDFGMEFASLWQLDSTEKGALAKTVGETVGAAYAAGLMSQQAAMKDLRQVSRITGVFTNITAKEIDQADTDLAMPGAEDAEPDGPSPDQGPQLDHDAEQADLDRKHELRKQRLDQAHDMRKTQITQKHQASIADKTLKAKAKESKNAARQNGKAGQVGSGARKRNRL